MLAKAVMGTALSIGGTIIAITVMVGGQGVEGQQRQAHHLHH